MFFSTLPFSIFSPLPFHLNYSLTAGSGRHKTFASTLFLCKTCLKFPSTVQPMGLDSSMNPNFCARSKRDLNRKVEAKIKNDPFWASGDTTLIPAIKNCFSFYPPNENCPFGSSGGHCPYPCSQKLLFPLPSMIKQSWALEGNFRALQLKTQIARFGPAARNDYFQTGVPLQIHHFRAWRLQGLWASSLK